MELNKLEKRAIELNILVNGGGTNKRYILKYPTACYSAYCPCIQCPEDCKYLEARLLYNKLSGIK
ncbi:MAG TPA: hypothetical protein PL092_02980 [Candidatus Pacearchaeota archaeon]|nr:hypothetical protein [Candidatus Pacearchaeota archaeon]